MIRPPIERYARTSIYILDWTVEPGVEWRYDDNMDALVADMIRAARACTQDKLTGLAPPSVTELAIALEESYRLAFPDRAFFIEIHNEDGDWLQIFQPFGVPKNV